MRRPVLLLLLGALLPMADSSALGQSVLDNIRRSRATGGIYAPGGAVSSLGQSQLNYGTGYRGYPSYGYGVGYGGGYRGFGGGFGGGFGFRFGGVGAYFGPAVPPAIIAPPIVTQPLLPGYGYGYGGYPIAGPMPPLLAVPPTLAPATEPIYEPLGDPAETAALKRRLAGENQDWRPRGDDRPVLELPPGPATPAGQARAAEAEAEGDRERRQRNYLAAYRAYSRAVEAAPDQPETRLKLVLSLIGISKLDRAVDEMDRLLRFSPGYAHAFVPLVDLFEGDKLAIDQLKRRVADWTVRTPGNPDRLFVLGAVMYFDGDVDRARQLLRSAQEFDGGRLAIAPLLTNPPAGQGPANPQPASPQPSIASPKVDPLADEAGRTIEGGPSLTPAE